MATLEFIDGPVESSDDLHMRQRYHTQETAAGPAVGKTMELVVTIDRPASEVWTVFKDFNLWQGVYGYKFSGVVGDLEGQTLELEVGGDSYAFDVVRVIPEQMIVIRQLPGPDEDAEAIVRGFHVYLLTERDGRTTVTSVMQQTVLANGASIDEALQPWLDVAADSSTKYRDVMVPALRELVEKG